MNKNVFEGAFRHKEMPEGSVKEADGCPTEGAVLKRFWREQQARKENFVGVLTAAKTRLVFASRHIDCQDEIDAIEKLLVDYT